MLANYLKIALKVLRRRKFYTFISLFGISLTLTIILLFTTMINNVVFPKGVSSKSERFVVVSRLEMTSADRKSNQAASPGYKFLSENLSKLKEPELVSMFTRPKSAIAYKDGQKIEAKFRRVDANYWSVFELEFISGRAFTPQEDKDAAALAVISESLAQSYFGSLDVLQKNIDIEGLSYQVAGVVKDVSMLNEQVAADIWVPIFATPNTLFKDAYFGRFNAVLLGKDRHAISRMQQEYLEVVKNAKSMDPAVYPYMYSFADTLLQKHAREFNRNYQSEDAKEGSLLVMFVVLLFVFLLLPSVNLMNINISRIMERASEIGVRKSFGASSNLLIGQFMVENLVLTFLGAVLGVIFTLIGLQLFQYAGLFPEGSFYFDLRIFLIGLGTITLFGLMSGIYPAWKMSRMQPVYALKGAV